MLTPFLALHLSSVTIPIEGMEVDGQRVSELRCELESGGLLASALVVGSLARQKPALDACAPEGGAYIATWTWGAGAEVEVTKGSPESGNACVQKALEATVSDLKGTCTATLLVGEVEGSTAALATLTAPAE